VALSTADTNKWSTLLNKSLYGSETKPIPSHDERIGPIRQRQRRLTEAQVADMAARYLQGASVYELAVGFGCNRATVAERLKNIGIKMRLQSPTPEVVDEMVKLNESGLSLREVGNRLGFCANTVRNCLRARRIQSCDTHGQES
jgi:hypothetical protein